MLSRARSVRPFGATVGNLAVLQAKHAAIGEVGEVEVNRIASLTRERHGPGCEGFLQSDRERRNIEQQSGEAVYARCLARAPYPDPCRIRPGPLEELGDTQKRPSAARRASTPVLEYRQHQPTETRVFEPRLLDGVGESGCNPERSGQPSRSASE